MSGGLSDRAERLRRLERLHAKLRDAAELRLAALSREREELEAARRAMLTLAAGEFASFGPLAAAVTRRIHAVELRLEAATQAQERQQSHAAETFLRAKIAGRARARAETLALADRLRGELADLIEATMAAKASRSTQG